MTPLELIRQIDAAIDASPGARTVELSFASKELFEAAAADLSITGITMHPLRYAGRNVMFRGETQ